MPGKTAQNNHLAGATEPAVRKSSTDISPGMTVDFGERALHSTLLATREIQEPQQDLELNHLDGDCQADVITKGFTEAIIHKGYYFNCVCVFDVHKGSLGSVHA